MAYYILKRASMDSSFLQSTVIAKERPDSPEFSPDVK